MRLCDGLPYRHPFRSSVKNEKSPAAIPLALAPATHAGLGPVGTAGGGCTGGVGAQLASRSTRQPGIAFFYI